MKLLLEQEDIEQAIVSYLADNGVELSGANVHVNLIASGGGMSATIDIKAGLSVPLADNRVPADKVQAEAPPVAQEEPSAEDLDREAIKQELDKLGVAYLPKAHTPTLQAMLDEAKAAQAKAAQTEEPPPFETDTQTEAPAVAAEPVVEASPDESPFGQPAKSAESEPAKAAEVADEEKPLFGS